MLNRYAIAFYPQDIIAVMKIEISGKKKGTVGAAHIRSIFQQ